MKCPKCGGQAFDYSADKLHCLKCGRTSAVEAQAGVPSSAAAVEQTVFDVDVQHATPAVPRIVKWGDHDPDHFRTAYAANYKSILELNEQLQLDKGQELPALITAGLVSAAAGTGIVWLWWMTMQQPGLIWVFIGAGVALIYWVLARWRRWRTIRHHEVSTHLQLWKFVQSNARLALQQQDNLVLGHDLHCPHCAAKVDFTPTNAPAPEGLKRCLNCGQHFYTRSGATYPVKFRLVNGTVAGRASMKPQRN